MISRETNYQLVGHTQCAACGKNLIRGDKVFRTKHRNPKGVHFFVCEECLITNPNIVEMLIRMDGTNNA